VKIIIEFEFVDGKDNSFANNHSRVLGIVAVVFSCGLLVEFSANNTAIS